MTLVESIQHLNLSKGNKGVTFISKKKDTFLSYKDLYHKSLIVLHQLQAHGIKPKQELVFQIEDNETFITVLWACLLGGVIPVPVTPAHTDEHRLKLLNIWSQLLNPFLMTHHSLYDQLDRYMDNEREILSQERHIVDRVLFVENLTEHSELGTPYVSSPSDIALIQFSSGSTGTPKGVILTHDNLLTNIHAMINRTKLTEQDSVLNWMPLTHDMGLIGGHLVPLVQQISQFMMTPALFIRKPELWLDKMNQYNITISSSPNFGFQHVLSFFNSEKSNDWDLSHIRLIFNGAEPINADVCFQFLDSLAPYGLKRSVMYTVYGMAEACLGVCFPPINEVFRPVHLRREYLTLNESVVEETDRSDGTVTFIDVGTPIDDCFIRICDGKDRYVPDGVIGHIQIKGRNVTAGYYNNPDATDMAKSPDGWLRTGDLGFMRNGRLIITGRTKDILFVNGQNYYAHDLERLAGEVRGAEPTKAVACGVLNHETHSDKVILFVVCRKVNEHFIELSATLKVTCCVKRELKSMRLFRFEASPKQPAVRFRDIN